MALPADWLPVSELAMLLICAITEFSVLVSELVGQFSRWVRF
jgi:hypothetical protein